MYQICPKRSATQAVGDHPVVMPICMHDRGHMLRSIWRQFLIAEEHGPQTTISAHVDNRIEEPLVQTIVSRLIDRKDVVALIVAGIGNDQISLGARVAPIDDAVAVPNRRPVPIIDATPRGSEEELAGIAVAHDRRTFKRRAWSGVDQNRSSGPEVETLSLAEMPDVVFVLSMEGWREHGNHDHAQHENESQHKSLRFLHMLTMTNVNRVHGRFNNTWLCVRVRQSLGSYSDLYRQSTHVRVRK